MDRAIPLTTHSIPRWMTIAAIALTTWGCLPSLPSRGDVQIVQSSPETPQPVADPFDRGVDEALRAWTLTQAARSPEDWDEVAKAWIQAVALMQSVPPGDPKRAMAQKKVLEYLRNAAYAISQAAKADLGFSFPSFDNELLDEKLVLYQSYSSAIGTPDVLILGSSRAAQGLDPRVLQHALAARGHSGLKVFNFGINGATAQVVDWMVREVLTAEQLPRLILWVDGSRAFNSGRPDRTYDLILASPGYQSLKKREPATVGAIEKAMPVAEATTPIPATTTQLLTLVQDALPLEVSPIDANGFIAVSDRFNPKTYYDKYPYVAGEYDSDYQGFNLGGVQAAALESVVAFARSRNIPLAIVNLPLTREYLDPVRADYEAQYRRHMQQIAPEVGFLWRDLQGKNLDRNDFFEDPSHLNAAGAAAVARQIAIDANIPWPRVR
jgi:hypothetical protein